MTNSHNSERLLAAAAKTVTIEREKIPADSPRKNPQMNSSVDDPKQMKINIIYTSSMNGKTIKLGSQ